MQCGLLYCGRGIREFHRTFEVAKTVPKNLKGKSKSSQEWLTRQLNDPYVKKAQEMNYRWVWVNNWNVGMKNDL
jgi:hypothetical protein